jgi:hypothetical protein
MSKPIDEEGDDPFESPRLLLSGAERHINTFRSSVANLRSKDWCAPVADPETPNGIIIRPKITVPKDMKQIVFDLTNNLRSALDHAVFAATLLLTEEEREGTKFPFGDTRKDLEDDAKRRCKNVPRELLPYLLAFEAHREGNPLLWGLNKLRNTKSHRVLIPVAATVALSGVGEPSPGTIVTPEWDPATGRFKANLELSPNTNMGGVAYSFRLEIAIGIGAFRGEPALTIFDRIFGEVERVVSGIEAETARLLRERGS